jgi:tripartite-type tricarboxylate transporter receptor subunit TctC
MTGSLGQPVIIENVSGANGTIGVGRAARAAYTICVGLWGTHVVNGAIYSLRYDLRTDFEPISLIVGNPQMIFGKKGIPAKDLKELIAWLKANPDKASQGTTTAGTHALGAFFQKETGTRFQFVPYRGEALGVTDLLAGQVQVMFGSATSSMPYIRAGALRPLAVTTAVRWEGLPDVPAVAEFVPDYEASAWHGIGVP